MTQRNGKTGQVGGIDYLNSILYEVENAERAADAYDAEREVDRGEIGEMIMITLPKGYRSFPRRLWREAIQFFLAQVWVDDELSMRQPSLLCGCICLALDSFENGYEVYGSPTSNLLTEHSEHLGQRLVVGTSRAEVTDGLARFVRNNRIRELSITLSDGTSLRFLKSSRRCELSIDIVERPRRISDDYDNY